MTMVSPSARYDDTQIRRLRVLCVIETIGLGGGAEQLLATLLPALRQRGIDVELAALFPWEPDLGAALEAQGVPVHRLNATGAFALPKAVMRLRGLIARGRYDIVWGNLRLANLAARLGAFFAGNPATIATFHSEGYARLENLSLFTRLSTLIERILLEAASAKVAVSKAGAADYAAFFGWSDFEVIYNCIDVSRAPTPPSPQMRTEIRARHGVGADDLLFVVPARYVPKKGHDVLLEALRILTVERGVRPRVLAFGVGPLKDELPLKAEELGLSDIIVFNEPAPHSELFPLMQCADAVVLPSLREPFGIVAAEAMALGAPVILTATDGFLEVVGDSDCALMAPPGDARALANAMLDLVGDPGAARSRAMRARQRVADNFDVTAVAGQWAALFERVAAGKRSRGAEP
jgi:glycosyltransferase involved in cell wall biosynthesis